MTVDWHVSNVPPSTYREGINSAESAHSINSTTVPKVLIVPIVLIDSAGISLSEKVTQAKYLSSQRHS